MNAGLRYFLIDDTASYTRLMLHELYTQNQNIDVLFLGSSHCYRSLDPAITDQIFGKNTFNGGSSSQKLDASYTLLVEAGKRNKLQEVYLELYYANLQGDSLDERTDLTSTYLISDYMKPSPNRLSFLLKASQPEYYANSFILGRRNWKKLLDPSYMVSLAKKKTSWEYRSFSYIKGQEEAYLGKGYVGSSRFLQEADLEEGKLPGKVISPVLSEDSRKALEKIADYCKKHQIRLIFFISPMPDATIESIGNYEEYRKEIETLSASLQVPCYDFNFCRKDVLGLTDMDFQDSHHLNKNGAEKFSRVFSDFFTDAMETEIGMY